MSDPKTVYGVCWQDHCEPWGWEPIALYWSKDDAEKRLSKEVAETAERYELVKFGSMHPEEAMAEASRQYSIQEYQIQ